MRVPMVGVGLALALAAQGCKQRVGPAQEHTFTFVPSKLELGAMTQNEPARANVELRHRGMAPVRIHAAALSARCRWDGVPQSIAPGASIALSVTCQSDLLGPLKESLPLLYTTKGDAAIALEIVGTVEPIIGFDKAFVDMRPEFGQTESETVHLVGRRAAQSAPVTKTTGGDMLTVSALAAEIGNARGFRLSCKGDRVGMHAGSLVVATGIAELPSLALSWGCRVLATLEVEPSNPYFNLRVSGDRAMTIIAKSSQPGFFVKSAQIVEGPFHARLEKAKPDGTYPITVRVNNAAIHDQARAATGKLLILSNDLREPRKEVPLFGFGNVNKVERPKAN